jgi:serine/threonine protein kinase
MSSDAPRTYGRYRLEERIGAGTIADAWRAKSFGVEGFEKTLVIKRLLPELAHDATFVEAFVEQAKLAMRLSHANVVQVFDLGRVEEDDGDSYYVAMEHVGGRTLHGLLDGWRQVGNESPVGFALHVAAEAAKGLDHAHRRRDDSLKNLGIVHADPSARNVLLTWDGEVKVSDFCVSRALYSVARGRLAEDARLAVKIASASPELARGESPGPTSDVFALGTLLYEMIAGVHPFTAPTQVETLRNVARARVRPLSEVRTDLPAGLAELVHRALAVDPRERYASCAELHEELVALRYVSGLRFGADDIVELLETKSPCRAKRWRHCSSAPVASSSLRPRSGCPRRVPTRSTGSRAPSGRCRS